LLEGIDDDYNTKLANAAELLLGGSKVLIVVELEEADFERAQSAFALINKFANELGAIAVWNVEPKLKGNAAYLWISSGLSKKYHSQRRHKLNIENTTDE
jgi:translation initiation factor IF-3